MEREIIRILSKYTYLDIANLIHSLTYKIIKCGMCESDIHEYDKAIYSSYIVFYRNNTKINGSYYFCSHLCKSWFDKKTRHPNNMLFNMFIHIPFDMPFNMRCIYYSGPNHKYDGYDQ